MDALRPRGPSIVELRTQRSIAREGEDHCNCLAPGTRPMPSGSPSFAISDGVGVRASRGAHHDTESEVFEPIRRRSLLPKRSGGRATMTVSWSRSSIACSGTTCGPLPEWLLYLLLYRSYAGAGRSRPAIRPSSELARGRRTGV